MRKFSQKRERRPSASVSAWFGLVRLEDRVQVRQAILQLVEGGRGLTRLSYGAQQLPWPQLCSCGWTSNLCPRGVKNYENFARVIVLSLSIVDGFLQRVCLKWLASCFLIPWSQRSSRYCAWRWPSLGLRGASRGCACALQIMPTNVSSTLCVCVCVCAKYYVISIVPYHMHTQRDRHKRSDRQYKQKKRDKEKKSVCIRVCARASTHTHTPTHISDTYTHTIHTYMSNLSLHTYHCLCLSL